MTPEEHPEVRDRLKDRLAHQWQSLRAERRAELLAESAPVPTGTSNFSRAEVPWGIDLAAAWSWRLLVIGAAAAIVLRGLGYFSVVTMPLAVALLTSALLAPVALRLHAFGLPRGLAALLLVIGALATVVVLLSFAGQQVANGASDLANSVAEGLGQIKDWLKDGPLHATDSQINDYLDQAQKALQEKGKDPQLVTHVTSVGTTLGHIVAGFFIVLFSTYFFLADGERIWSWFVRLSPRAARDRVDSSGRVAWISLTKFVQATVIVAMVDAIGIMIVAVILQVPFVLAIGVLVFLGAFVPMIGATIAGSVAVLVALVDRGPLVALLMLGGVILVQQIEGHVLQPFLMGRWVSLHPLGVIIAIACGVVVAGIAGALIAVPFAAASNAVIQHLSGATGLAVDPERPLDEQVWESPDDPDGPPDAAPEETEEER